MERRLARDVETRGLSREANKKIFLTMVEPMHKKYVAPQRRWADVVLGASWGEGDIKGLLRLMLRQPQPNLNL